MITNKNMREQISALADGEVSDASLDAALALLRDSQSKEDWEIYHRIGDVLKSDELDQPLSAGFAARMAARLDAEAPHVQTAPQPASHVTEVESLPAGAGGMLAAIRRYLVPGMTGTAALLLVVVMAPQWAPDSAAPAPERLIAQSVDGEPLSLAVITPAVESVTSMQAFHVAQPQTLVSEDDIVRDPRIDQYLMAHQRFSPSAYSSSQFARSATFATEADK